LCLYLYLKFALNLLSLHFSTNSAVTKNQTKQLAIDKLNNVGPDVNTPFMFTIEQSSGLKKRAALARAIAQNPLKTD
jgi:ABC-type transporter Mla maintaining outer membrane lipid asymmetry ATPase subunit MlaF